MPTPSQLWEFGARKCGICGLPLMCPDRQDSKSKRSASRDHVFPKSPAPFDNAERTKALKRLVNSERRIVMAHRGCNGKKSNRAPTGCEVIFLMAVNVAHSFSASNRRTRSTANRRRRKKARERAEKGIA